MVKKTPRQRRHARTKAAILEAARQLINEEGADGLSMRAIARRIDYSPAGLYEYFGSKEEIVTAVCVEGHTRLRNTLQQVDPDLPPVDYLREIGLAYIAFAVQHPDYYLTMFTNVPAEETAAGMMGETSSYPILLQAIQRGIDAGVFKVGSNFGLQEMAYAAWSLVHGIAMLRITFLSEYPIDFANADREALMNFSRGLQAG